MTTTPREPLPYESPTAARADRGPRWSPAVVAWAVLALLGLGVRVWLAVFTWGTNDADSWAVFGHYVNRYGLYFTMQWEVNLNHPPLPVYWAMAAYRSVTECSLWDVEAHRPAWFPAVFKLPGILADAGSCWLLYRIWQNRAGPAAAMAVAAGYAWSLCAILVSGYHCNTDNVYAFFCLLSVYYLEERRAWFAGGLALAAAINVKLTPVLLIPVLLLTARRWPDALRFVGGLAVGVIPFVPLLVLVGDKFYANAIRYGSNPDNWGVTYLLMLATGGPPADAANATVGTSPVVRFFFERGRHLLLGAVAVWAVAGRLFQEHGRASRYDLGAVTLALFLVLAPGFGLQYAAVVLPLLFASRPRWAAWYGLVAGGFLLLNYWAQWPGKTWPPNSQFRGRFPWPSPLWGLAAWALLAGYVIRTVFQKKRSGATDGHG